MTKPTIGTGQDLEAIHAVAQERPIRDVHTGWWVRTFNDDGSESFDKVRMWKLFHHESGQRSLDAVQLLLDDHTDPSHGIEVVLYGDETVLCVKSLEAKKLGLTVERA